MIFVFAGPSISHEEVQKQLDCTCLPPVSHGDLIRLLSAADDDPPHAIAIIDGFFEGAPSVWHKEILHALDRGIPVYGCSSMGALRAAELAAYGMQGVGRIYRWYRDGVIEDDDEVAVLHGPAEVHYAVASEPMVNIRATLELALERGIVDAPLHDGLISHAKSTFYKQRSWRNLLASEAMNAGGMSFDGGGGIPAQLGDWLAENRVDLKRDDALELLALLAVDGPQPPTVPFRFARTHVWERAQEEHAEPPGRSETPAPADQAILDRLRLDPERYHRVRDRALLTWLSANRVHTDADPGLEKAAMRKFRMRNGLVNRAMLEEYMENTGLDEETLTGILRDEARVQQVRREAGDPSIAVLRQIKLRGDHLQLSAQVHDRQAALKAAGIDPLQEVPLRPMVLAWYFESRLGIPIPDDLAGFLGDIDCHDEASWYRNVVAEYLYWRLPQTD